MHPTLLPRALTAGRPPSQATPGPVPAAVAVQAAGLVGLVSRGGTAGWLVVRVPLVLVLSGAVLLVVLRGGRTARGAAALAAGVVGTAAGAGVGVLSAVKGGPVAATVSGLVCLTGGLVLLVAGVALLTRATPRRLRVLVVPALVLPVLLLLAAAVPAVAATSYPRPEPGSGTPSPPYRDVVFPASDGVLLSGWLLPSRNRAAVVLLHGGGSTRWDVLAHAQVLRDAGYGVLLYDARGHGRSEGRAMGFGWSGDHDVQGAVRLLAGEPGVDPARIGAVGLSMGAEQAVGALAAVPGLRAVVAEGATGRVHQDDAWLSERYGWRGALQEQVERLQDAVTDLLTSASPPTPLREAVARSRAPVLLVAAGEVADETAAARHVASAAPDRVEVWTVQGAGHTAGLRTVPDQWRSSVVGFLDRALAPR